MDVLFMCIFMRVVGIRQDIRMHRCTYTFPAKQQQQQHTHTHTLSQAATLFQASPPNPTTNTPTTWHVTLTTVNEHGTCRATGARLAALDLEDSEWDAFATAIAKLAEEREKGGKNGGSNFAHFQRWLEHHGVWSGVCVWRGGVEWGGVWSGRDGTCGTFLWWCGCHHYVQKHIHI